MFSLDELAVAFLGHLFVFSCVVERNIRLLLFFSCSGERERDISPSLSFCCFSGVPAASTRWLIKLIGRKLSFCQEGNRVAGSLFCCSSGCCCCCCLSMYVSSRGALQFLSPPCLWVHSESFASVTCEDMSPGNSSSEDF